MLKGLLRFSLLGAFGIWLVSACSSAKEGTEGEACYSNGTCNAGLTCLSNTCVDADGGDGDGSGGKANQPSVDFEACFACGDAACPSQRQSCDGTAGCPELLECTIGCGDDVSCKSGCSVEGITAQELAQASTAVANYVTCSVQACSSECVPDVGLGTGGSGDGTGGTGGGDDGAGGRASGGGNSTGGRSSGGSSSGGAPNDIGTLVFDGEGVGVGAEDFGIDGGFYILEDSVKDGEEIEDPAGHTDLDPLDSSVEPSSFELSDYPCVSGTVAQVLDPDGYICETNSDDCDWEAYWGGGIGLSLNIVEEVAVAWDADASGVTGFRFNVAGAIDGAPLRFVVEDTDGEQFCVNNVAAGSLVTIEFSDLDHECWDPTNQQLDPTKIKSISWQFVPNASTAFSIDEFCVNALYVLD